MARTLRDPVGHLYRIDPDRSVHRMADGVILSNGIAWSPDDRVLYHCDSAARAVFAYEYDLAAGRIGGRRAFAPFGGRAGRPAAVPAPGLRARHDGARAEDGDHACSEALRVSSGGGPHGWPPVFHHGLNLKRTR